MRLALDARQIHRSGRRGIGKSLVELYRNLARLRPDWQIMMFHQAPAEDDPLAGLPNVQRRRIDIPGDRWDLWQRVRLTIAVRLSGCNVVHCPANTAAAHPGAPLVLTIHDLIPLEASFATPASASWGRNVAKAARKARRILTPSNHVRDQITRLLGVPSDKVTVCHWAADPACQRVTDTEPLKCLRRARGIQTYRPYVLGFGGADPRKNTAGILQAWAMLPEPVRDGCALLLVGIQEPALTAMRRQAQRLALDGSAFLDGFVGDDEIPALISGATALCYPSRGEGFGLPILDAFACRTPVLTGDNSSLPEVAGDAAVLVNAEDPSAIANGLMDLLGDESLRAELVARGTARLAQFSWAACAERTAEAIAGALA
jgi:glycosyltransferase involved in cell wall biosynthesis